MFTTRITSQKNQTIIAEWFSLNPRPARERRAIARQMGEIIEAIGSSKMDYVFITAGKIAAVEPFETEAQARTAAENLALTSLAPVILAQVIGLIHPPDCMFCDLPTPATTLAADWLVCDQHYNALTEPWPEELPETGQAGDTG